MGAQAASKRYQASYIGPDRERHKAPSTPAERPEVEGLVDGVWYPGELRMWTKARDGSWSANVMWSRVSGENRLDTVPADHVRPVTDA